MAEFSGAASSFSVILGSNCIFGDRVVTDDKGNLNQALLALCIDAGCWPKLTGDSGVTAEVHEGVYCGHVEPDKTNLTGAMDGAVNSQLGIENLGMLTWKKGRAAGAAGRNHA